MENILSLSGVIISFLGILIIIWQKIPALSEMDISTINKKTPLSVRIKPYLEKALEKIKSFSLSGLVHKVLSKIKILNLKIEKLIDFWLSKLRQKKIKNKELDIEKK